MDPRTDPLVVFLQARFDEAEPAASRDVAAKRRILELHQLTVHATLAYGRADAPPVFIERDSFEDITSRRTACTICAGPTDEGPCETVRLLAAPYADHPDYRPEWDVAS